MTGVVDDSWCDLPADILNAIAERLRYVEQIRFRSVCKSWRSNTNPIKHAADKLPWVMSCKEDYDSWIEQPFRSLSRSSRCSSSFYLHDPSQKRKYTLQHEILIGAKVHASKHGWLLLSKNSYECMPGSYFIFYTPFTHEIIQLPKLHMTDSLSEATFSTAPTSPDCSILVLTLDYKKVRLSTCRLGDKTWSNVWFDGGHGEVDDLAFAGGVYYCLFSKRVMGSFKIEQEEWRLHPHPLPPRTTNEENFFIQHSLIESHEGNLLLTCQKFRSSRQVFRYDESEIKWFEIENLGNRMLFLGVTCMLLPAVEEASELANTIHLAGHTRCEWDRFLGNHYFGICSCHFHKPVMSPLQTYDWIGFDTEGLRKIWIQPGKQT
ncbi:hypothetical protein ACOSP7_015018 [Xanthoceras sorbifolium]